MSLEDISIIANYVLFLLIDAPQLVRLEKKFQVYPRGNISFAPSARRFSLSKLFTLGRSSYNGDIVL